MLLVDPGRSGCSRWIPVDPGPGTAAEPLQPRSRKPLSGSLADFEGDDCQLLAPHVLSTACGSTHGNAFAFIVERILATLPVANQWLERPPPISFDYFVMNGIKTCPVMLTMSYWRVAVVSSVVFLTEETFCDVTVVPRIPAHPPVPTMNWHLH